LKDKANFLACYDSDWAGGKMPIAEAKLLQKLFSMKWAALERTKHFIVG